MTITGQLLVATPTLLDPAFHRTVVFLVEHQPFGALGVVLNRPSETQVGDLLPGWEQRTSLPRVIFDGGPVETEGLIAVARQFADDVEGWREIAPGIALVDLGASPDPIPDDAGVVRIFGGYTGWSGEQLEMEIEEGAWWVLDADPLDVITDEPDQLWREVVGRQGGRLGLLRDHPDDPAMN
ncbi:MAG: YqgE/AlgH family protein [Acidimicrobiales bacterium]|jgi:putative transcriptional regulator